MIRRQSTNVLLAAIANDSQTGFLSGVEESSSQKTEPFPQRDSAYVRRETWGRCTSFLRKEEHSVVFEVVAGRLSLVPWFSLHDVASPSQTSRQSLLLQMGLRVYLTRMKEVSRR